MKQLQAVFPSRYTRSFAANALHALRSRVSSEDRLLLVSAGRLCAMLARRLLCSNGECVFRNPIAASGNRQRRLHREIVAAVLRQLVCDLCGDSQGAQQRCLLCGVSPYGAASGIRQLRQDREIVALTPHLSTRSPVACFRQ